MSKPVFTQFQPSLTEWFEGIGDKAEAEALRLEDNQNRERLEVLYQTIGLPYERPEPLPASDLKQLGPAFQAILDTRGDELCAIRLVPSRADLPKLRQRGLSIRRCYEDWVLKQDIPWEEYTAYICPHSETLEWSATFVVKGEGIFGEIIEGMHSQLTHGDTYRPLVSFQSDFSSWRWNGEHEEAKRQVARMLDMIRVPSPDQKKILSDQLQATFARDYLQGYFEVTVWPGDCIHFIDYNRLLPAMISTPTFSQSSDDEASILLRGVATSSGVARGPVVIVGEEDLADVVFEAGSILVCDNTDVRFLPLMKRAGGFVTNRGSMLSHASIVARELKKPCVVGTKNTTEVLKNGDRIEVDGGRGVVRKVGE